ncbi:hypothetical protein HDU67_006326 [Dinochytrium kinnereticum]|nr:hypothetical protein HDU67_006326 [Dinochytrium kinnereticum]
MASTDQRDMPSMAPRTKDPPSALPDALRSKSSASDTEILYESLHAKRYVAGFLYKIDELGVTGKPLGPPIAGVWGKWWAELWGPYLHLWRIPEDLAVKAYYPQPSVELIMNYEAINEEPEFVADIKSGSMPLTLNVSDAVVELLPYGYSPMPTTALVTPMPPIPYDNFLALTTTGSNLFHLSLRSSIAANAWAGALRLAAFEASRVNEHHSLRLLAAPNMKSCWSNFALKPFVTLGNVGKHFKEIHYEGPVKVRLSYGPDFHEYYVVVSNRAEAPNAPSSSKESGSFRKFISAVGKKKNATEAPEKAAPEPTVSLKRAQISFFASKLDAHNSQKPLFRFEHVRHVYEDLTTASVAKGGGVALKVEGVLVIPDKDKRRSEFKAPVTEPKSLAYPGTGFDTSDLIGDIAVGLDARPRPQHFHILLPDDPVEAGHWIVAILASFHLDADLQGREKEIEDNEVGILKSPTESWGLLYLSPDDIAGLAMSPETLGEVKLRFSKVFNDKCGAKRAGYLDGWNDAVKQGKNARTAYERQEIEGKAKGLVEWLLKNINGDAEGKGEGKKRDVKSPTINITQPTVDRKASEKKGSDDAEKRKSKRVSVASAKSTSSAKNQARKSAELKIGISEGDEEGQEGEEDEKRVVEGNDKEDVENEDEEGSSESGTEQGSDEESGDESEEVEKLADGETQEETKEVVVKEAEISLESQLVPTDLVLLALPVLQPNGIWIWQYQFANKDTYQPQPTSEIVAQAPAVSLDKKDDEKSEQESDEEDSDEDEEEEGDSEASSDDEVLSNIGKDTSSIRQRNSAIITGDPLSATPGEVERLIPAKKSKKAAAKEASDDEGSVSEESGEGSTESSGDGDESDEEDDDEEDPPLKQPVMPQNMMLPGFIPGLLPLQPNMMLPNMLALQQQQQEGYLNQPSSELGDEEDDEDEVPREKFRLFAQNSLLAQLPDKTPAGVLLEKKPGAKPSGPLVRLDPDTLESQERALAQRQSQRDHGKVGLGGVPLIAQIQQKYDGPSGPLIDVPVSTKPKIEGGLLGEVDRREKEKEMLKKMGQYRPGLGASPRPPPQTGPPGMPGMPGVMGGFPGGMYGASPYGFPGGYPYPPPMYGGYPYPPYPYGPYPPPHVTPHMHPPMAGGMPPNMSPNMHPQMGGGMPPNMSPNMPPNGPPNMAGGMHAPGYPMSEWGETFDDPMAAYQQNLLREQWLETERHFKGMQPPVPYLSPRNPNELHSRRQSVSSSSSRKHGETPDRKSRKAKQGKSSESESESGTDDSESDGNPPKLAKGEDAAPLLSGKGKGRAAAKNDSSDSSESSNTDDSSSEDMPYNRSPQRQLKTSPQYPKNFNQRVSYMPQPQNQYATGPYGPAANYYPQPYHGQGALNPRASVQSTPGRELIGERKRPPRRAGPQAVAANSDDEEEDEEAIRQRRLKEREQKEQAAKAAEEERKRRLRRRGVEDEGAMFFALGPVGEAEEKVKKAKTFDQHLLAVALFPTQDLLNSTRASGVLKASATAMYQSPSASVSSINMPRSGQRASKQGFDAYHTGGSLANSPHPGSGFSGRDSSSWANDGYYNNSSSFASRSMSNGGLSRPQSPYRDVLDQGSFHGSVLEQQLYQQPNGSDQRSNQQPQQQYLPSFLMNAVRDSPDNRNNGRNSMGRSGGGSPGTWAHPSYRNRSRSRSPPPHHHHHRTGSMNSDDYGMEYGSPSSPRSSRLNVSTSLEDAPPIGTLGDLNWGFGHTTKSTGMPKAGLGQETNGNFDAADGRRSNGSQSFSSSFSFGRAAKSLSKRIRIVGFAPNSAAKVYNHFATLGKISSHEYTTETNWMTIVFEYEEGCEAALASDTLIMDGCMIAVTRAETPEEKASPLRETSSFQSKIAPERLPTTLDSFSPSFPSRKSSDTSGNLNGAGLKGLRMDSGVSSVSGEYVQEARKTSTLSGSKRPLASSLEPRENVFAKKPRYLDDDTSAPAINPPSLLSKVFNMLFGW